jgi:hypothetical protein
LALEIDKVKDYWLLLEIIGEQNGLSILIAKTQIKGHLLVELLIESDIAQCRRSFVIVGLRRTGQQEAECERKESGSPGGPRSRIGDSRRQLGYLFYP